MSVISRKMVPAQGAAIVNHSAIVNLVRRVLWVRWKSAIAIAKITRFGALRRCKGILIDTSCLEELGYVPLFVQTGDK